jgi:hypothetical protein
MAVASGQLKPRKNGGCWWATEAQQKTVAGGLIKNEMVLYEEGAQPFRLGDMAAPLPGASSAPRRPMSFSSWNSRERK